MSEMIDIEFNASKGFEEWMFANRVSLAFSTYELGRIFLIGLDQNHALSVNEVRIPRTMGICAAGPSLYIASQVQLWRFENIVPPGQSHDGYDCIFAPRLSYVTGDLDTHDIALDKDGRIVFINTAFSCLAAASERCSFIPLWRPPFITALEPGDRCHMNGLAMDNGQPRYVTMVGNTDSKEGWRAQRVGGGLLMEVPSGETIASGFCMPHSPRLADGRLWMCDSGRGDFGWVDPAAGRFNAVAPCPGFARGMSVMGRFALIGLSRPRNDKNFGGLPLDEVLEARGIKPFAGMVVVDLVTGQPVHWLSIEQGIREIYDVEILPGFRRPRAIGLEGDDIQRFLSIGTP